MAEIKVPVEKFQNLLAFSFDNNIEIRDIFTFNVKDKTYVIPKIYTILCSTILDEFQNDKAISSFNIDVDDPKNLFENIISLLKGKTIVINPDEYLFYSRIISILKIESIYPQFQTLFNEELKSINCIDFLNYKNILNFSTNNEIDFISKNFSDFKTNDILNIDKDDLIQILNKKTFVIKNEDDFFKLIEDINQNNQNYKFMFDYVHYENLSREVLDDPKFDNIKFDSNIVKKLILMIHGLKPKYIHDIIYDFINQKKLKKEYQEIFVEYCFLNNDVKSMKNILNLDCFDFNLKYNILFLLTIFD